MSDDLCTLAQYKLVVPTNQSVSDAMINGAIGMASESVQDYLHRRLKTQIHKKWLSVEGSSDGTIFLPDWPVSQVLIVGQPMACGTLFYSGTDGYAMVSSDMSGMTLSTMGHTGVISSNTLTYAAYPAIQDLAAAVTALANGFALSVSAPWLLRASRLIKPIANQPANQSVVVESVNWIGIKSVVVDDFCLELVGCLGRWVYCEWTAGYTLPTPSVAGDLPAAITTATIRVASDLISLGLMGGGLADVSEDLGDYSYGVNPKVDPAMLANLVARQESLLAKYRRLGWLG
jgi:hypothetical protein